MSEIERVNLSIDAHFEVYGSPEKHPEEMGELVEAITLCALSAYARVESNKQAEQWGQDPVEMHPDAERLIEEATKFLDTLKEAAEDQTATNYKVAAEKAMVARRATYPLKRETPWAETISPKDALHDDDDPFSWSIFDTVVEPIQKLLPPLYQLAAEGWKE